MQNNLEKIAQNIETLNSDSEFNESSDNDDYDDDDNDDYDDEEDDYDSKVQEDELNE